MLSASHHSFYNVLFTSVCNPFSKLPNLPHSSCLKWLDHKFGMSRQPWWHVTSFNLIDDQRVGWGHFQRKLKAKSNIHKRTVFTRAWTMKAHLSLRASFQRGAVASQPGRSRGNSSSDRLIGLDPNRLTRRTPPVRGPELTPWSCFNSGWGRAERLQEQQIPSHKAPVSAAAVHY